jgi:hypothetical protein
VRSNAVTANRQGDVDLREVNTLAWLGLEPSHSSYLPAYEDGTDRMFRNVGI